MARTAVNPQVLNTPSPQGLERLRITAEDSKTWKRGEMCFLTSGTVTPLVATGKTDIYGIFAEEQATATSSSEVEVYILEPGTRLLMYVMTNGTAAASSVPTVGTRYGAEGLSNVSYLDTGTANGQFEVIRPYSDAQPYRDSYADTDAAPGLVVVKFGYVS